MTVGYLVTIPTFVLLDNKLSPLERLLFAVISATLNHRGYCPLTNEELARHLRFTHESVTKQVSSEVLITMLDKLISKEYVRQEVIEGTRVLIPSFHQKEVKVKVQKAQPVVSGTHEEIAIKVLDYLNESCMVRGYKKMGYKAVKVNLSPITARLSEGHTYDTCIAVINTKFEDDYFKKNTKYLSPQTLFRPSNFEKYVTESESIKDITLKVVTKQGLKYAQEKKVVADMEGVSF